MPPQQPSHQALLQNPLCSTPHTCTQEHTVTQERSAHQKGAQRKRLACTHWLCHAARASALIFRFVCRERRRGRDKEEKKGYFLLKMKGREVERRCGEGVCLLALAACRERAQHNVTYRSVRPAFVRIVLSSSSAANRAPRLPHCPLLAYAVVWRSGCCCLHA